MGVLDDAVQRFADAFEVGTLGVEPVARGVRVGRDRRERLVHLVGDRRRQLAQRRDASDVRELGLRLLQRLDGEHVLRQRAGDDERRLHPVRAQPQR